MARQARSRYDSTLVSVVQRSSNPMFRDDADRNAMMEIFRKTQQKYGFICYAFCLVDDFAFRLIIDTRGRSISRIIQSISIAYARYRKVEGKFFTDRFKSEALKDVVQLNLAMESLRNRSIGDYSSFCIQNLDKDDVLGLKIERNLKQVQVSRIDPKLSLDEAVLELEGWITAHGCTRETMQQDKAKRNRCIREFRRTHNISLKDLGTLFGISESSVSKILNFPEDMG